MTDTYPSAPPPAPEPRNHAPRPADEEIRTGAAPEENALDGDLQRLRGRDSHPAGGDEAAQAAPENAAPPEGSGAHVWSPPVPQFPARPSQAPLVQYTGPQTAPVPQYVPPQPPPNPQQQYTPQPQYAPQGQQGQYVPQQGQYATPQMYAPPQQVYGTPPPSPRMSKARVGRRFMRRAVTSGSGIGRFFGGARLPITLLVLALVGVISWLAVDRSNLQTLTSAKPNAVAQGAIVLPPEAPVVTTYLNGLKNNDLEGTWNALSAKEKIRRIDNGEDKTVMKAVLDFIAKNSVNGNFRFVGAYGTAAPNDFSKGGIYYYAVDIAAGSQSITRPMHFIVDDQGKVESVYDPLYRLGLSNINQ